MNTPVSGGAVSDALALADELERDKWHVTAVTMQRAADCLRSLALTQPAVPALASEPVQNLIAKWRYAAAHWGLEGLASLADCADELEAAAAAPQPAPTALPEKETPAMHDAVMEVLYRVGGMPRTRTNELWQAYRSAILAAQGGSEA